MAQHRHKRETNARRLLGAPLTRLRATTLAAPLAVVATAGVVSIGVVGAEVSPASIAAPASVATDTVTPDAALVGELAQRRTTLSRGLVARDAEKKPEPKAKPKPKPKPKPVVKAAPAPKPVEKPAPPTEAELMMAPDAVRDAIAGADTRLWTTELLNLWTGPADDAVATGTVEAGEEVLVTGRSLLGRVEIVWGETEVRWVTAGYLVEEKPAPPAPKPEPEPEPAAAPAPEEAATCDNGTSVPSGVSGNIRAVHAAVCAAFPEITTYGTFRSDGEHAQGIAVDIMVSGDRGWQVAEFVRENYAELGVNYLIYSQQIWSVDRAGEGWRGMEDRGSTTANHYDHVHVTTYF